jgi:hypothetical protein
MQAFIPGESPPEVKTAIFFIIGLGFKRPKNSQSDRNTLGI